MTTPDLSGQQFTNLLRNGSFEEWASGLPTYWMLAGAGASIAKDTTNFYLGVAAAAVTRAGADATLRQSVLNQTLGLAYLKGKTVSAGVRVRKGAGALVRLGIDDGVSVEWSGHACHVDAWELVGVLAIVSKAATKLDLVIEFAGANVQSQVDAATLTEGEAVPAFTPNPADPKDPVNLDQSTPAAPTGLAATSKLMSVLLTWTQNAESDVKAYEVQRADDAGFTSNVILRRISATTWTDEVNDVTVRYYRIRAVRASEAVSAWSSNVTGAGSFTPGDTGAPAVPTGVAVTAGFQLNVVRWTPPADADWDRVEIWRSTSNDSTTATKVGEHRGIMWVDDKLANATTYYYWLKSRDTSGNVSGFHAAQGAGVVGTTLKLGGADVLTTEAIITNVAQIGNALITTAMIQDAAIDSAKIGTAAVTEAKIGTAAITNAKIGSAAITNAKIGNLEVDSAKIANLTVGTGKIGANAVSTGTTTSNDAQVDLGTSQVETELASVTLTTDGGEVLVIGKAVVRPEASGNEVVFYIRKDAIGSGAILDTGQVSAPASSGLMYHCAVVIGRDTSPASSQTYKLSATNQVGINNKCYFRRLSAINLKK